MSGSSRSHIGTWARQSNTAPMRVGETGAVGGLVDGVMGLPRRLMTRPDHEIAALAEKDIRMVASFRGTSAAMVLRQGPSPGWAETRAFRAAPGRPLRAP
ncbi:MAG: hypothetical protein C0465_17730 [Ralstonia sp.]|nr:hypothetical protein [Ralstonia sp.]